jgi:hypothetical protein
MMDVQSGDQAASGVFVTSTPTHNALTPAQSAPTPTHMINANSGSQMYVGTYDAKSEMMTVVGKRQTLDYSSNYVWAAAGM